MARERGEGAPRFKERGLRPSAGRHVRAPFRHFSLGSPRSSGLGVAASLAPCGLQAWFRSAWAGAKADFTPRDLAAPRAMFERLPAWGKRAAGRHQNCFESVQLHARRCPAGAGCRRRCPAWRLRGLGCIAAACRLHRAYVGNVPPCGGPSAGWSVCSAAPCSNGEGLKSVWRG